VDQGYRGEVAAQAAKGVGIELGVVKLEAAKTRGALCCYPNAGRWTIPCRDGASTVHQVDDPLSGRCQHRAPGGAFVGLDVALSQAGAELPAAGGNPAPFRWQQKRWGFYECLVGRL